MARRKDHTAGELKALILSSAENLLFTKGLPALTARALATEIGYTPGTIYNVYKDMDDLLTDINYATLGRMMEYCRERVENLTPNFKKLQQLAYAYVDFAHDHPIAWGTLFAHARKGDKPPRLPKAYQERLRDIFELLEKSLAECLPLPKKEVRDTARLLWACLHGITILTLDGRLSLAGVERPHALIDDLLKKYLAAYLKSAKA